MLVSLYNFLPLFLDSFRAVHNYERSGSPLPLLEDLDPLLVMGKWKSQKQTGCRHGSKLAHEHELGSGGRIPLPIVTAVCKQDQLLHVCSALQFVLLVLF